MCARNISNDSDEIYQLLVADSDSDLSMDGDNESSDDSDDDPSDSSSVNSSDDDRQVSDWRDISNDERIKILKLCDGANFDLEVKSDASNFQDPYKAFLQFMPLAVFEHTAKETNRYAEQCLDKTFDFPPRSRYHKWTGCTMEDIQAMVALDIGMGLCRKSVLQSYFSDKHWMTATPHFSDVMSRDNYCLLRSFLHFNNNESQIPRGSPGYDPLFKVRPAISMVENTYLEHVSPGKCLSVDESMLKFTGRLWCKQYLPSKPSTKWGVKLWSL